MWGLTEPKLTIVDRLCGIFFRGKVRVSLRDFSVRKVLKIATDFPQNFFTIEVSAELP